VPHSPGFEVKGTNVRDGSWRGAILLLAAIVLMGGLTGFLPARAVRSGIALPSPGPAPSAAAASDGGPRDTRSAHADDGGGDSGPLKRFWSGIANSALGQRIGRIVSWIASFFRFLWTIPKALLQGDSSPMIDALGDLLSRTSSPAEARTPQPAGRSSTPLADPQPATAPAGSDSRL
jgi:hypothetical protein